MTTEDSENQQQQDAPPAAVKETGYFRFHDPEEMEVAMANAMPGGEYRILPLSKKPFYGEVRAVDLGHGVAMCSAKFLSQINILAELGRVGNVGFLLPEIIGSQAILNGKPIDNGAIQADCMDASYHLKTSASHTAGMVLVEIETLRELMDVHQRALPPYLKANTSLLIDPIHIANLNALLIKTAKLLNGDNQQPFWVVARDLLRDSILTELVTITTHGQIKHEQQVHRYQSISMARIDHYIDTHALGVVELQDLCKETALSLRTLQRVIRNRTGLTAWTYIRKRKLAFVRQALTSPDDSTTVTNTALKFGFLHLGRFSAEYHAMYGELPSATLRRERG